MYLENKCRLDCLYGPDSAIPHALNPLQCPTQSCYHCSWLLKNSMDFDLVFAKFHLFGLLGWLVTAFQTFEQVKKFGFLAEFSHQQILPHERDCIHCPSGGRWATAPLCRSRNLFFLSCIQAGVLCIQRSYFRHSNYPEGIRHVPCHEWPLVAQDPPLQ